MRGSRRSEFLALDQVQRAVLDEKSDFIVAMPTHFSIEEPFRSLVINQEQLRRRSDLRLQFQTRAMQRYVDDEAFGQDIAS